MKHNLRAAFLSLLLVLTLGVMPVFAESADHAMDWTHGIGSRYRTDVTSALPFEDELFFISGSQLLRVDDPEYEPEVVCNLEDIIWSEALKQSGYYGQVMLLNGGAELVLFSANEGRLYSFVPPTDDTMVRMQMVTELDYSTLPSYSVRSYFELSALHRKKPGISGMRWLSSSSSSANSIISPLPVSTSNRTIWYSSVLSFAMTYSPFSASYTACSTVTSYKSFAIGNFFHPICGTVL